MTIGIVLAKTPSYSETFFNSKLKGLQAHGVKVTLFVQDNANNYNVCKVVKATRLSRKKFLLPFHVFFVLLGLVPHLKTVLRFIKLEKSTGRNRTEILKHIVVNSHILKAKLDWLHFGFATMALQSENVAKAIGAKMAVSCRGYDMDVYPLKYSGCYDLVWERVDKVHAISKYMLSKAYEHGLKPETPHAIIYPAVDLSLFQKEIPVTDNKNTITKLTTIARLHWIKGLSYTLEALAILKQNGIKFRYQIIGSGDQYEPLRFAVHQLDLEDCVDFLGQMPHKDVVGVLKTTDVYIQYSMSEGFCNAVLEAQALGCLCIVSDGGGLLENILDSKTGWVVPKAQPNLLAKKLEAVIRLEVSQKQIIRENAVNRIKKEFQIEKQIELFIKMYKA